MSLLLLYSLSSRLHYVIGPSAGWVDPTAAEIKAGQLSGGGAATAFGSEDSPKITTNPFTFTSPATGLTAGTSYRMAFVWFNGSLVSNVSATSAFTTAALGRLKYWTGTVWAVKPSKVWDGAAWTAKAPKYWTGTVWA